MKSTSRKHIVALDFYRFVAAFGVAIYHINQFAPQDAHSIFRNLTADFDLFVDFFFVLSGYVIGLGYSKKVSTPVEIGIFLRRRLARIYPLHLVTTLCFIALFFAGFSSHRELYTKAAILSQLLMVQQ